MRLIDADGVIEEIRKNKLLAREAAAKGCMEIIKNATTYAEPPGKYGNWVVPIMAQALVNANCPYLKVGERQRNMITEQEQTGQIRFA